MKEWWLNLQLREKQILIVGGLGIGLILFYLTLLSPLSNKIHELRHQLSQKKVLLSELKDMDGQIKALDNALNQAHKKLSFAAFLSAIQKEVATSPYAKSLTAFNQGENETVHLTFHQVGFDEWVKWLASLSQRSHFAINKMTATQTTSPGIIDAELVITQL